MDQEKAAKQNLSIMWFANFFIAGSITMVLPFLSLYIDTLGNFSEAVVQRWSGLTFGITFVAAFIFSPVWGRLGDRIGRKPILFISALGLGLSVFLISFVTSIWQLFLLRLFMGIFTGFISLSQALISTQTPSNIAGKVLGTLQTGSVTGSLMGPLIGGILADQFGYALTFRWISFAILISAGLVAFGIKEYKVESDEETDTHYSSKEVLLHILRQPMLVMVMFVSLSVQIAHFSIQPILSLFVEELHGPANLALFSGIAFSAAGLGNLLMARRWGRIGDRVGYIPILILLLFFAAIAYFPAAFVTNVWQLVILRFFLGVAIGGIIPVRVAYIRQQAPLSIQGEVLGYNTSIRFLGNSIGPAIGGMIAGSFGFTAVFYLTSGLLFISGLLLLNTFIRHKEKRKQEQSRPV